MIENRPEYKAKVPEPITDFRNSPINSILIPALPEDRKCTDLPCLILFGLAIIVLVIITSIFAVDSNISREIYGVDNCGNICGKKNPVVENIPCSGANMINKPILLYQKKKEQITSECVASCNATNKLTNGRCYSDDTYFPNRQLAENIKLLSAGFPTTIVLFTTAIVLFYAILSLFYFCTSGTIFSLLIFNIIFTLAVASIFWLQYTETKNLNSLLIAIMATVGVLITIVILIVVIIKRKLVIRLLKEALQAIRAMPTIAVEPILMFLILAMTFIMIIFFMALVATNGKLQQSTTNPEVYEYIPNISILGFIIYSAIVLLWISFFYNAIQVIIIAGAVSAWFFARDESSLHCTVCKSFSIAFRYHSGTAALGSFIVTLISIIKTCINQMRNNNSTIGYIIFCLLLMCISCIEEIVEYLTRKAYIQTAMHGKGLCKSGMRGARLIWHNLLDAVSIDVATYCVMYSASILIVIACCAIGYAMNMDDFERKYIVMIWALFLSCAVLYYLTQALIVTVETIFMCYCEDKYMQETNHTNLFASSELSKLMDDTREALAKEEERKKQKRNQRRNS